MKVGIINYGMGNLQSVRNALEYINVSSEIESDPARLALYDKLILPGVGAFGLAMENIRKTGLQEAIMDSVQIEKKHLLGICLGMQLLFDASSEHGDHEGLGLVKGRVSFFGDVVKELPVPHVGWNEVQIAENSALLKNIASADANFYFVHSYYCLSNDEHTKASGTEYGIAFDSVVEKDNIFACQFHPEKSQKSGLAVLKNFIGL